MSPCLFPQLLSPLPFKSVQVTLESGGVLAIELGGVDSDVVLSVRCSIGAKLVFMLVVEGEIEIGANLVSEVTTVGVVAVVSRVMLIV